MWRLGIIGAGWAGEQHAWAARMLPDRVELLAVADCQHHLAESAAKTWQAPIWDQDYRQLLSPKRLDAVSICLPHRLHAQVAVEALQAGLHVLVEKPLASTLAEADMMITAAQNAGKTLMVAENVRFDATCNQISEIVRSGSLGEVFLIKLSREHHMHDYLRERPWFLSDPDAGILLSGGVHDFEILRMIAGEIESVYAVAAPKVIPEMVADDTSLVLAQMESGAKAVLVESFSLHTDQPGVHGSIHGRLGSLWFHRQCIRIYLSDQDGKSEAVQEIEIPPQNTFVAEMAHFLDCLDGKVPEPVTSGEEERKPLLAVLASYQSICLGRPCALRSLEG